MPWKRFGKCVFKTTKSGKKKEKEGCSDSVPMAKKYLKALYANADDVSEQVDGYLDEIVLSKQDLKMSRQNILNMTTWSTAQEMKSRKR